MKKILFLSIILAVSGIQLNAQRNRMIQQYLEKSLNKNASPNSGPAPDYSSLYNWAASPYKHDNSDSIPVFLKHEKRDERVDVFFIHPTSYIGMADENDILQPGAKRKDIFNMLKTVSWNADLRDTAVNNSTDNRTILYQASVFNADGRIFAPRYRQANIKAFFVHGSPEAEKAFDLAYSDIKKAFQYYLQHENHGRPIIIASHSQGSLHAIRLLQEFFDGNLCNTSLFVLTWSGTRFRLAHLKIFLWVIRRMQPVVLWVGDRTGKERYLVRLKRRMATRFV